MYFFAIKGTQSCRSIPGHFYFSVFRDIVNSMKIVLKNLCKYFPAREKNKGDVVKAVDDISLEIPDGKLVGLLGPSGCGKSTTLNLICGLEEPTSGQIFFGDRDVTRVNVMERGVGMVFQSYALYPHLSVFKNIRFPLENLRGSQKLSKEEMKKRVLEAAAIVQLDDLMERRPSQLSGGQQQRVAIARALVKKPEVLLLDEPLSNLDARLRLQTREEIRRIQTETGITTIFVTHDQEEAMSISDLIVVMKDGQIMQTGKPQEVYDDPAGLFVAKFMGTPPINVFDGALSEDALYVGDKKVLRLRKAEKEGQVFVAVRPEGFIPDNLGPLECYDARTEIMGRDVSIVCRHSALSDKDAVIRAIIDADDFKTASAGSVSFSLKPHKVFAFDRETGRRIGFEAAYEEIGK